MQIDMNRFDDIKHTPLRVYNRAVVTFNLLEDFGREAVENYFNLFSEQEKKQIFLMNQYIRSKGKDAAYRFATKDLVIEEDLEVVSN